jgi:hypothetical protein
MGEPKVYSAVVSNRLMEAKVIEVRLTPTQIVSMENPKVRFRLLNGGEKGAALGGYYGWKVQFDDERTSAEVREAHEKHKAELEAKDKARRAAERERRNVMNRTSAWRHDIGRLEKKVVEAAEECIVSVDGDGIQGFDTEDSYRLVVAVTNLRALRERGPAPPDCGHAVCQADIFCEIELEEARAVRGGGP